MGIGGRVSTISGNRGTGQYHKWESGYARRCWDRCMPRQRRCLATSAARAPKPSNHICARTRPHLPRDPTTGLAWPQLRRDWGSPRPARICTLTGPTPNHICAGTGPTPNRICAGTRWAHPRPHLPGTQVPAAGRLSTGARVLPARPRDHAASLRQVRPSGHRTAPQRSSCAQEMPARSPVRAWLGACAGGRAGARMQALCSSLPTRTRFPLAPLSHLGPIPA